MSAVVADILDRAADLIEPEGAWVQCSYGASGRHCAIGAIIEAARNYDAYKPARAMFSALLGHSPIAWNDAPERTQAEVVAKLREAAGLARETAND